MHFIKKVLKHFLLFSSKATYIFFLVILAILLGGLIIQRIVKNTHINEYPNTIPVTGKATKKVKPDQVTIIIGTNLTDKDILTLQEKSHNAVNKSTNAIKNLGINANDISTNLYEINPNYDYSTDTIKNYQAQIRIEVQIKDIEKNSDLISKVIKEAISSGLNEVYALDYSISNREEIIKELKDEAIENAKKEKKHTEEILDVKLGKLVDTNFDDAYYPLYRDYESYAPKLEVSSTEENNKPEVPDINITPKSMELSKSVTLYYEIKN